MLYPNAELDNPLGLTGKQPGINVPSNYNEKSVSDMIPPFCDANGDKNFDFPFQKNITYFRGSNHAGYYGFRDRANNTNLLRDNGSY